MTSSDGAAKTTPNAMKLSQPSGANRNDRPHRRLLGVSVAILVGGTLGNYRAEMDRCAANAEACVVEAMP
jgi:hypothetical protein